MNDFDKVRKLSGSQLQAAWTAACAKGDSFYIGKKKYQVAVVGKKIFRLKDDQNINYSFKWYGWTYSYYARNKAGNIFRNVEGEIIVDLINQYNPFHILSDVFKLTVKVINRVELYKGV